MSISMDLFLLASIFAFLANFSVAQFTIPQQNISGTFGVQLNSYPQNNNQNQQQQQAAQQLLQQLQQLQTQNYYAQQQQQQPQYPSATDHYGYPSPEQLAQIPAPPLHPQQVTQPYSADWQQGQTSTDAWRTTQTQPYRMQLQYPGASNSGEHTLSNNNNLPYSQNGGIQQQQQQYAGQYGRQQFGGADPYGQQQRQQQQYGGQFDQSQYSSQLQRAHQDYSNNYMGPQGGGNVAVQQLLPQIHRDPFSRTPYQAQGQSPLNPQYQSPSARIVFPGANDNRQQQEEQSRHSFWFNSASRQRHSSVIALMATFLALMTTLAILH